jgi:hypothetical protein
MDLKYDGWPVVTTSDLFPPTRYLCEDAYLANTKEMEIRKKMASREARIRKLVREVLEIYKEVCEANAKTEAAIKKAQLRASLNSDKKTLKRLQILKIGKESFETRQEEMRKIQPEVKHFPKIKKALA